MRRPVALPGADFQSMRKAVVKFILVFAIYATLFVVQKPLFMEVYATQLGLETFGDRLAVLWHGLSMDFAVAGYLTVIPAILIICMLWTRKRWPQVVMEVYIALSVAVISAVMCLDLILYSYWGFRIDMTPFFYFATSPSAALASATWWECLAGATGFLLACALMWWVTRRVINAVKIAPDRSWKSTAVMVLLTAALFIPIRGSVTVSTMNPSRAYFSARRGLNHAATNPVFNLLYSATHQNDFASQYRFMDDAEAAREFRAMGEIDGRKESDSTFTATERPDVVFVILESFSSHLMPSLGGEAIATGLDSIAGNGLLFTQFYANSFRTDRALPSILSALPGQPSTSILKYVDKIERLPSWPGELAKAGYALNYYYGGDTNFTNMQAYLMSMGFSNVVSDSDFSISQKASKWGAPDHLVFERALRDITGRRATTPQLDVIQTSSSHEPFEVPYSNPRFADNERANAFAYTDSCLTAFVNALSRSPRWQQTLVVIVPDHYGCYPKGLKTMPERHAIPLVITGGALTRKGRVDALGSQADIAATLLGALKLDYSAFPFSRNLLAGNAVPVAVMTEPGSITIVTPDGYLTWSCDGRAREDTNLPPESAGRLERSAQAYLQTLYTYIANL